MIADEIRRQVDHQARAAEAFDTKATVVAAALTLGLVVATLAALAVSIRPRVGAFSYGPDPAVLVNYVDNDPGAADVALAESLVDVRDRNEGYMRSRVNWLIGAIGLLIATVLSLGVMVAVGAIQ